MLQKEHVLLLVSGEFGFVEGVQCGWYSVTVSLSICRHESQQALLYFLVVLLSDPSFGRLKEQRETTFSDYRILVWYNPLFFRTVLGIV
jgi:hypothetical protein